MFLDEVQGRINNSQDTQRTEKEREHELELATFKIEEFRKYLREVKR